MRQIGLLAVQQPPRLSRRRSQRRIGAVLSIELVMALPILFSILLATIEFGILLMASQGVNAAAHVGTREAALAGSTDAQVNTAVQNSLNSWSWKAQATTQLYINGSPRSLTDGFDDLAAARSGDLLSVTVTVRMIDAAPNLLTFVGITLAPTVSDPKILTNTYVTRKE